MTSNPATGRIVPWAVLLFALLRMTKLGNTGDKRALPLRLRSESG